MPKFGSGTDKLTSCDQFSEKKSEKRRGQKFQQTLKVFTRIFWTPPTLLC